MIDMHDDIGFDKMPKELDDIINAVDYIEYDLKIETVNIVASNLEVRFSIVDTEEQSGQVSVLMQVINSKDFLIAPYSYSGYSGMASDHPLLWKYKDVQCDLYTSGKSESAKELAFELYQIHYSLFGHYSVFNPKEILRPLQNGYGLFQRGAKQLLTRYADKLNAYGIATNIIAERQPEEQFAGLQLLFLGDSYFIGSSYEFEVCGDKPL